MKHHTDSDPEVVLCAVEQPRRVVVNLNHADIDAVACANIDTTAERAGETRFAGCEIGRTWAGKDSNTNVVAEVYAIAAVRGADKRVSKGLER